MSLGRYDAAVTPSFVEGLTLEGPIGHAGTKRKNAYLLNFHKLLSLPLWKFTNVYLSFVSSISKETSIPDQVANRPTPDQSGTQLVYKDSYWFSRFTTDYPNQSSFRFIAMNLYIASWDILCCLIWLNKVILTQKSFLLQYGSTVWKLPLVWWEFMTTISKSITHRRVHYHSNSFIRH